MMEDQTIRNGSSSFLKSEKGFLILEFGESHVLGGIAPGM